MKLVFATNNKHKIEEVQQLIGRNFKILSLDDIGCNDELPETGNTLDDNAEQKAKYIFEKYNLDCFADDTGLEIEALNCEPGVCSARYAGKEKDAEKNIEKVLVKLKNSINRNASFKTVICLVISDKKYLFNGIVKGHISKERKGKRGFGYDPIFIPEGFNKSFAEMSLEEKNKISHRSIAIKKFIKFLNELKS